MRRRSGLSLEPPVYPQPERRYFPFQRYRTLARGRFCGREGRRCCSMDRRRGGVWHGRNECRLARRRGDGRNRIVHPFSRGPLVIDLLLICYCLAFPLTCFGLGGSQAFMLITAPAIYT